MKNNRYFEFDEKGFPYPVEKNVVTKHTLTALLPAAMASSYEPLKVRYKDEEGKWQDSQEILASELRFQNSDGTWMSKAEVGAIRLAEAYSHGDEKATAQLLDRVLGKPKQEVDVVQTKLTFMDWLKHRQMVMAEQDKTKVTVDPAPVQPKEITADVVDVLVPALVDDCSWL